MTSNFAFVQATPPSLFADCSRAESYLVSDPRLDVIFPHEVGTIVEILSDVRAHALSADVA